MDPDRVYEINAALVAADALAKLVKVDKTVIKRRPGPHELMAAT